jgi:hypothetical protein
MLVNAKSKLSRKKKRVYTGLYVRIQLLAWTEQRTHKQGKVAVALEAAGYTL